MPDTRPVSSLVCYLGLLLQTHMNFMKQAIELEEFENDPGFWDVTFDEVDELVLPSDPTDGHTSVTRGYHHFIIIVLDHLMQDVQRKSKGPAG